MAKLKDKVSILKATREKVTYKGVLIRLASYFSPETFQARKDWHDSFKVMKSKGLQPGLLFLARLSFKIEGEKKSFLDKKKQKEFFVLFVFFFYHQTNIAKNINRLALRRKKMDKKEEEEQEQEKEQRKIVKKNKMTTNTYLSIISLNVNGLNAPIKRHRVAAWIRKTYICCL